MATQTPPCRSRPRRPRAARSPPPSAPPAADRVADHSLLIAAAIAFLAPFVFMLLTSLMTTDQALSPKLWPDPFQWGNYTDVFDKAPMLRYALNTLHVLGRSRRSAMLVSSVPVAYALARLRWRGRDAVFLLVLVAMMLPPQVTIVPLYVDVGEARPRRHAVRR